MVMNNPAVALSVDGINPSPFPRSSGVSRFDLTYADFAVAATEATIKILELPSDRQILIRDAWVEVTTGAGVGAVLDVGDELSRDGFLRDLSILSSGLVGKSASKRGAYLAEGQQKILGDGVGLFGAGVDPTVTLSLSGTNLDTMTAGEWSLFIDYAWVDVASHPANPALSKAIVSPVPPRETFTPKLVWKIKTYSHTTGAINHDGVSSKDFIFTVDEPVFLLTSVQFVLTAGTDEKQLTLDWYIDSARTERHPETRPSNYSPIATAFELNTDPLVSARPAAMMGYEFGDEVNGRMYMRLSDASSAGGSGTYKVIITVRVPEWQEY